MPLDTPDHGRMPQGGPAVLAMLAGIGAGLAIAPGLPPPAAQWAGTGLAALVLGCQAALWWLTAGHKRTRGIPVAMGDSQ